MHVARWKTALLLVVGLALALAVSGPAMAAKQAPRPSGDASVASDTAPVLTADAKAAGLKAKGKGATTADALKAYWTPARMEAALDADENPAYDKAKADHAAKAEKDKSKAKDAETRGEKPAPTGPPGQAEPAAMSAASPAVARAQRSLSATFAGYNWDFWAYTEGKVFFTDVRDGRNYVCSGTVVNSEGKNSVWTAGHCVHGGPGGTWHANWVFVPAYKDGWAPYGYWYSKQLWTKTDWISSGDWASDMGVSIMWQNNGWSIASYLGGQGITWNQSKRIAVRALGYPAEYPFDGRWLYYCDGTTFPEWEFLWWSAETLGLSCNMTGGSSGGGWIAYLNSWGGGYLDGNNSFKYDNDANHMYSPYYDDTAANLYNSTRWL
jgi:V8-like Glu-specific endopeptidase